MALTWVYKLQGHKGKLNSEKERSAMTRTSAWHFIRKPSEDGSTTQPKVNAFYSDRLRLPGEWNALLLINPNTKLWKSKYTKVMTRKNKWFCQINDEIKKAGNIVRKVKHTSLYYLSIAALSGHCWKPE